MTIPWKSQPKTWRDRLYDLAMSFSKIIAKSLGSDRGSSQRETVRNLVDETLRIDAEVGMWQSSWFTKEYPQLQIRCGCRCPAALSCICSVPASRFPNNDFALLQVECWALQLLISNTLSKSLATEDGFTKSWITQLSVRSSHIACYMETASAFSAFGNTAQRFCGITESLCRTIFPSWTLRDYRGISNGDE